jgi:hypothetical protein
MWHILRARRVGGVRACGAACTARAAGANVTLCAHVAWGEARTHTQA